MDGLDYNYHRYYDPKIGKYITADPIGLDGGFNIYGYTYQNPVNYFASTGEFVPQIIEFGLGVGLEYFTNPCASAADLLLAGGIGGIGALGGGLVRKFKTPIVLPKPLS